MKLPVPEINVAVEVLTVNRCNNLLHLLLVLDLDVVDMGADAAFNVRFGSVLVVLLDVSHLHFHHHLRQPPLVTILFAPRSVTTMDAFLHPLLASTLNHLNPLLVHVLNNQKNVLHLLLALVNQAVIMHHHLHPLHRHHVVVVLPKDVDAVVHHPFQVQLVSILMVTWGIHACPIEIPAPRVSVLHQCVDALQLVQTQTVVVQLGVICNQKHLPMLSPLTMIILKMHHVTAITTITTVTVIAVRFII